MHITSLYDQVDVLDSIIAILPPIANINDENPAVVVLFIYATNKHTTASTVYACSSPTSTLIDISQTIWHKTLTVRSKSS